jgi:cytochrome P450
MDSSIPSSRANPGALPCYRPSSLAALKALLRDDILGEMLRLHGTYGDIFQIQVFGTRGVIITRHPDHIAQVLLRNGGNYLKTTQAWKELCAIFGEGIFTSEGEAWRWQRQAIQPVLHNYRVGSFAPIMTRLATQMIEGWAPRIERGEPIDMAAESMRLTLRIVCQCLFGVDLRERIPEFGHALEEVKEYVNFRSRAAKFASQAELAAIRRRCEPAIAGLSRIAQDIIDERRRGKEEDEDLLSALLAFRDRQSGAALSEKLLRDEIMTMLVAGHETTTAALTWAFHLLASHQDVERRVREELADLGGRTPVLADLPRLSLLERVVRETLRLYPPGFLFERMSVAADTLGGYHVPAGIPVALSIYLAQRHPEYWEDPDSFNPDRFLPEKIGAGPRHAYFPFGMGQRACLGGRFAMVEMQLVLATVLQRVTFRPVATVEKPADPGLTLRPLNGLHLLVLPAPA